MKITIIGCGLIGGSLALTLKRRRPEHIIACLDLKERIPAIIEAGVADRVGSIDNPDDLAAYIPESDLVVIATPVQFVADTIIRLKPFLKKNTIVTDVGSTKNRIMAEAQGLLPDGVHFIGGHPMSGIEKSGFENSYGHLFDGTSMILCKDQYTNLIALKAAEMLFTDIGFTRVTITTAAEHDRIIAFTSQLAHIVSSAYIKSETAKGQLGFSAGSYKDMTRVARLDENMWTELFMENKEHLSAEIDNIIKSLVEYSDALSLGDSDRMKALLLDGKKAKEAIG